MSVYDLNLPTHETLNTKAQKKAHILGIIAEFPDHAESSLPITPTKQTVGGYVIRYSETKAKAEEYEILLSRFQYAFEKGWPQISQFQGEPIQTRQDLWYVLQWLGYPEIRSENVNKIMEEEYPEHLEPEESEDPEDPEEPDDPEEPEDPEESES